MRVFMGAGRGVAGVPVLSRHLSEVVQWVNAPFSLVVLSGGWPSRLIAVHSLGLPLLGTFFPASLHRYFKPKLGASCWNTPSDIISTVFPEEVGFLVSSSLNFFEYALGLVGSVGPMIALVFLPLQGTTPKEHRKHRLVAQALLWRCGLHMAFFLDSNNGGAMDVCHFFGFGPGLCSDTIPVSLGGLLLVLRHFLDGGTKGYVPVSTLVSRSLVPALDDPSRQVLWHLDIIQSEGLFPCGHPCSLVYCPSYFFLNKWVARPLAIPELLRLYQLPLLMDAVLRALEPDKVLPFEDSPTPDLFASNFRQLWGASGGVLGLISLPVIRPPTW
jgi:hypothetical protein